MYPAAPPASPPAPAAAHVDLVDVVHDERLLGREAQQLARGAHEQRHEHDVHGRSEARHARARGRLGHVRAPVAQRDDRERHEPERLRKGQRLAARVRGEGDAAERVGDGEGVGEHGEEGEAGAGQQAHGGGAQEGLQGEDARLQQQAGGGIGDVEWGHTALLFLVLLLLLPLT